MEKGPKPEPDYAIALPHHLGGRIARVRGPRHKAAMRDTAQLMAAGLTGPAGVPALCPVVGVPGSVPGIALILFPSTEEPPAKGLIPRVIFATRTLVQFMVTGVPGMAGAYAAGHAVVATCVGTAHATAPGQPMVEECAGALTLRFNAAIWTHVLWTGAGGAGRAGAAALHPVEVGRRLASGTATTPHPPGAAVPARAMTHKSPGATHRPVQEGPSKPEEVLLETLMMLNLELLS